VIAAVFARERGFAAADLVAVLVFGMETWWWLVLLLAVAISLFE
jgi:hypothetical protein